ncbi:MAG: DUF1549 and DUF1553 domain-containing protein [Planctomycetaceae bacterium]
MRGWRLDSLFRRNAAVKPPRLGAISSSRRITSSLALLATIWLSLLSPAPMCAEDGADAPAQQHWAFRQLVRPAIPHVQQADLVRTPVDNFIEAALEKRGLTLSPPADRETLFRRLCFDLVGLPPSPEDAATFALDASPDAWARAVNRLLASPHYGERWGKYWLDVAGYADSNGYFNADSDRPLAYRYRDYVLRAFNDDKPFDRFVVEQLAGDELSGYTTNSPVDEAVIELLTATHFLRNAQDGTSESDGNPDELRTDRATVLEGAVQITMNSLLGLTIQCCRCHDHKFEPITQREYYQLQAVFYPAFPVFDEKAWIKPRDRVAHVVTPGEMERWEAETRLLDDEIAGLKRDFANWTRERRPPSMVRFSDDFDAPGASLAANWSSRAPGDDAPAGTPELRLDASQPPGALVRDGALCLVESGAAGDRWLATREKFDWTPAQPGEWIQATFDLKADRLDSAATPAARIGFLIAAHDFDDNSPIGGGNVLIDGNPAGGAAVHLDYPGDDSKPVGDLGSSHYVPGHNYGVRVTNEGGGKFRLEQLVDGIPEEKPVTLSEADLPDGGFAFEFCCGRSFIVDSVEVMAMTGLDPDGSAAHREFADAFQSRQKTLRKALKQKQQQRREKPGGIAYVTDVLANPPAVHVLERGNYAAPGSEVQPAGLAMLSPSNASLAVEQLPAGAKTTGRRLALARWLTRPNSPASSLLARVIVNRVWQHHFGMGLVATPDNFGVSGSAPSHPELFEFLADELMRSGWSLKSLHRLILQSAVYAQSSALRSEAFAADPDNRLLWRFRTSRLDAEAIRDAMLTLSGELDDRLYGPYTPTSRQDDGSVIVAENAEGVRRRGVYLQHRRTQINTMAALFDSPVIVTNCPVRSNSTIPLQSLALLNSEFVRTRASAFSSRLEREESADPRRRIELSFRLAIGRAPDAAERAAAERFLNEQTAFYVEKSQLAVAGNQVKASQQGIAMSPETGAERAWHDFCQMLLAGNAFLYVD